MPPEEIQDPDEAEEREQEYQDLNVDDIEAENQAEAGLAVGEEEYQDPAAE